MFNLCNLCCSLREAIDSFVRNRTLCQLAAGFDESAELSEAWIFGESFLVTSVDLLNDDGDFQESVGVVENRIGNFAAGATRVVVEQFVAREVAGKFGQHETILLPFFGVSWFDPIAKRCAEIHQRIADRRHFPIEHGDNVRQIVRRKNEVVVLVIVVNQSAGRRISGKMFVQPRGEFFYVRNVVRTRVVVTFGPTFHLSFDVTLRRTKLGETRGFVINAMNLGEIVDENF